MRRPMAAVVLSACAPVIAATDRAPAPEEGPCAAPVATFVEAAAAHGLGGEDLLEDVVDFMASTRDGGLVPTDAVRREVDGTMALESRDCGEGSAHPGSCNVTGFDGTLLGWRTTPAGALRFDEGVWCADPDRPLSFRGVAAAELLGLALWLKLDDVGVVEPDWDPVASPDARVFGLQAEVWQVPRGCALADAPCGGAQVATGVFVRTDALVWDRW